MVGTRIPMEQITLGCPLPLILSPFQSQTDLLKLRIRSCHSRIYTFKCFPQLPEWNPSSLKWLLRPGMIWPPLFVTCPLASLPFTSVLQPPRLFWGFPVCLTPFHSGFHSYRPFRSLLNVISLEKPSMTSCGRFPDFLSQHLLPSVSLYGFLPRPWLPEDSDQGCYAQFLTASKTSYIFNIW